MKIKTIVFPVLLIFVLALASALWWYRFDIKRSYEQSRLPQEVSFDQIEKSVTDLEKDTTPSVVTEQKETTNTQVSEETQNPTTNDSDQVDQEPSVELPKTINLAVPFTSQAPRGDWGLPYQEACEEASLIMVNAYYEQKSGILDSKDVEVEIAKMVDFEEAFFGTYLDTTVAQTSILAEQFYGFENMEILENPTVEDIKKRLVAGYPVLIPAAGQALGNPFFTAPGPLYHMLVVRGYTEKGFITNDPGTRHGEAYIYSFDRLMSSIHDWNDGLVNEGPSVVLIIMPN